MCSGPGLLQGKLPPSSVRGSNPKWLLHILHTNTFARSPCQTRSFTTNTNTGLKISVDSTSTQGRRYSGVKGGDDYRGSRQRGGPAISTDWTRPAWKDVQDSWWATAAHRHERLSFACVFKPCQFKHAKEFKAFKHKTRKSWTEYWCDVFGAQRAASHRQQDRTEHSFASSCIWTNKYKSQFKK